MKPVGTTELQASRVRTIVSNSAIRRNEQITQHIWPCRPQRADPAIAQEIDQTGDRRQHRRISPTNSSQAEKSAHIISAVRQ
jgi:hypothetical protein